MRILPTAIILLTLTSQCSIRGEQTKLGIFDGPDFKLKTRIFIQEPSSINNETFMFETILIEGYSNARRRSRLDFEWSTDGTLEELLYYCYISEAGRFLLFRSEFANHQLKDCFVSGQVTLAKDLFAKFLTSTEWLKQHPSAPEYLIGPARLLHLFQINKLSRQINCTSDQLIYTWNRTANHLANLVVYYENKLHRIPYRIEAEFPTKTKIQFDFLSLEDISHIQLQPGTKDSLDFFTLPIGKGCSDNEIGLVDLLNRSPEQNVLSFRAQLFERLPAADMKSWLNHGTLFVAQDCFVGALRKDFTRGDQVYSISIYELRNDRVYNIRQGANRDQRCVTAQFLNEDSSGSSREVLKLKKLLPMGTAQVRNVEVEIFEFESENLPEVLFPTLNFIDQKGKLNHTNSFSKKVTKEPYSIVYYFSVGSPEAGSPLKFQGRTLSSLLRIDILQGGELLYRLEIYRFAWHLAQAANGDHQKDLFAMINKCIPDETETANRRAVMLMELSIPYSSQVLPSMATDVQQVLASSQPRNQALARAIGAQSSILSSQIDQLESRLFWMHHELIVRVSARLSQRKQLLYGAIYVANGDAIDKSGQKRSSVTSLYECFWEAAHQRHLGHLLLAFCHRQCFIELVPSTHWSDMGERVVKNSKVFSLSEGNDQPCSILAINVSQDLGDTSVNWMDKRPSFPDECLHLSSQDRTSLDLVINKVQIRAENELDVLDNIEREPPSLQGIGLSASGFAVQVASIDDKEPVDLEWCHASCLAEPSCRSYSLCMRHKRVDCLLSQMSFENKSLLAKISAESRELEERVSGGSMIVGAEHEGQPIELKLTVDRRCNLHSKKALEMFVRSELTSIPSGTRWNKVDNIEHCAQQCLNENLNLLRPLANNRPPEGGERNWCAYFIYLPEFSSNGSRGSQLCWRPSSEQTHTIDMMPDVPGLAKTFYFRYSLMHRKHFGVRLLSGRAHESRVLNKQVQVKTRSVERCAQACFEQAIELESGCQSFDFIQMTNSEGVPSFYCYYNSINYRRALELELLSTQPNGSLKFWHYEPIQVSHRASESSLLDHKHSKSASDNAHLEEPTRVSMSLVLVLSLLLGLVVGSVVGNRKFRRRQSTTSQWRFLRSQMGDCAARDQPELGIPTELELPNRQTKVKLKPKHPGM